MICPNSKNLLKFALCSLKKVTVNLTNQILHLRGNTDQNSCKPDRSESCNGPVYTAAPLVKFLPFSKDPHKPEKKSCSIYKQYSHPRFESSLKKSQSAHNTCLSLPKISIILPKNINKFTQTPTKPCRNAS